MQATEARLYELLGRLYVECAERARLAAQAEHALQEAANANAGLAEEVTRLRALVPERTRRGR